MIRANSNPRPTPSHPTRRDAVRLGGTGLVGLTLPGVLRARGAASPRGDAPRADSCILLFLGGGPSHLDTWDLKPDAPDGIRGEFRPIETSTPGIRLTEHLPRLARQMHRCALVRSASGCTAVHGPAAYVALTGHMIARDRARGASVEDYPAVGSVVGRFRPPRTGAVPYLWMPYHPNDGGLALSGLEGGWSGHAHDPWFMDQDPNEDDFEVAGLTPSGGGTSERLARRRLLLGRLDSWGAGQGHDRPAGRMISHQAAAFGVLESPDMQRAFRLALEPETARDAYGRTAFGQSVLLARRLVEAGSRVVCVSASSDINDNARWDTHSNNFGQLREVLLPELDAALSSLIADLAGRGLLERTLVVAMGEFGREPRIGFNAGREHWFRCYSLFLAGGGIKAGYVHGSSDRIGAHPSRDPVTSADVVATIYRSLGVPHDLEMRDSLGRPLRLVPEGRPIADLFA